ncbi:MucBP domain-containing protein [Enterococcus sp. AZ192]|uniref:MucBP domain-containing protein n=1 Tax=unclassified Enterococcus TaxID=2608891 RepID=UPI003D2D6BAB
MKRTNLSAKHKQKVIHSFLLLSLLAPILLAPTVVFAEDFTVESDQETTMQTQESEETIESTSETTIDSTETLSTEEPVEPTPATEEATSSSTLESTISSDELMPKAAAFSADTITIADPFLKQDILKSLGLPADSELTQTDMEKLTYLSLSSAQISSLSGLETAVNLATIYINTNNAITDFSPLEQLTALTYVTLQTTSLNSTNFPDLRNSPGITNLSLGSTSIDNDVLPKIAQLTNLKRIYLDSNMAITTIEPLKALPNLTSLSVQFCGITDFTVINDFPVLSDLAAFGQNTGRNDPPTMIGRSTLDYDAENETLFIPFSMMPNRMTNFDGIVPPFTTSNSASNTYFDLNGEQLPASRLQITDLGITISGISTEEFTGIHSFEYNARLNNPAGSYAKPDGYSFYAISSGTYLHQFNVVEDGKPVTINYQDDTGKELLPSETLNGLVSESFDIPSKEISGYELIDTIGKKSGVFSDQEQVVTFIYKKIPDPIIEKTGRVIVHYVDNDNQTLKDDFILSGTVGDSFSTEKIAIEGYVFKEVKGNETGLFTKEDQVVTYVYTIKDGKLEPIVPTTPSEPKEPVSPTKKTPTKSPNEEGTNPVTFKKTSNVLNNTITGKKFPATGEQSNSGWLWLGLTLLVIVNTLAMLTKVRQEK